MKKSLKIIMFFVILILTSTIVFATESDVVNQYDETEIADEYGIMPISQFYDENEYLTNGNLNNYENTDIWKIENHTDIQNSVYGDIYVMSNSVNISSEIIEGNVFVMADNVKISGNIYGSVFIMANSVEVSGKIQDAYIMANKVNITETGEISRNVKVGANTFNLKGVIYRNLSVAAENINIEEIPAGVNVFGNLDYSGKLNANESQISGEIKEIEIPKPEINKKAVFVSSMTDFIIQIVTALAVIALIVYVSTYKYEKKEIQVVDYLKDIGIGFLYFCMIPIVSVILMITVIGLPIGIFGLLLYFIAIYISIPITSIEISKLVLKENGTKVKSIFIALLIFVVFKIVKYIPIIGDIIRLLAILFGIRIIVKTILNKRPKKAEEIAQKE